MASHEREGFDQNADHQADLCFRFSPFYDDVYHISNQVKVVTEV